MIFLTVGTQFPFDRLIGAVDQAVAEGIITEDIVAQIGQNARPPQHFSGQASMDKTQFDQAFRQADTIISHAGMGTITQAMDHGKPLLVLPRRKCFGEVVNDHQVDIAEKFSELGHLIMAGEAEDLGACYLQLRDFSPCPRQVDPAAVQEKVTAFLSLNSSRRS